MLTKRVIPTIIVREDKVVQSRSFGDYLPVGTPEIAVKYFSDWGADEIILLDISVTKSQKEPNFSLIEKCAKKSRVPLTVGGGIGTVDRAKSAFSAGADKVSINTAASNKLFMEIGELFGAQAVVYSIDVKNINGRYYIYDYKESATTKDSMAAKIATIDCELYGELLVQSVDRDGLRGGYDINLLKRAMELSPKPTIALGGYGKPDHLVQLFKSTNASAGGIGNAMHHLEHSLVVTKSHSAEMSNIRFETNASYQDVTLDDLGRIQRRSETFLDTLFYLKIDKESI